MNANTYQEVNDPKMYTYAIPKASMNWKLFPEKKKLSIFHIFRKLPYFGKSFEHILVISYIRCIDIFEVTDTLLGCQLPWWKVYGLICRFYEVWTLHKIEVSIKVRKHMDFAAYTYFFFYDLIKILSNRDQ